MWSRLTLVAVGVLLACSAHAAPATFVSDATSPGTPVSSRTPSEPAGTAQDDLVFLLCTSDQTDGTWTTPADFTQIHVDSANNQDFWLGYKIRGATAGNALTCAYSGTAGSMRATAATYTGEDTTTPFAVTFVSGSHYLYTANDAGLTANPAIGTVDNDDLVLLVQFMNASGSPGTPGAPTGYTLDVSYDLNDRSHYFATKAITSTGTETPGTWTHNGGTGYAAGADTYNLTLAISPAAGAAATVPVLRRRSR